MKIISSFYDYYDRAVVQDDYPVYKRTTKKFEYHELNLALKNRISIPQGIRISLLTDKVANVLAQVDIHSAFLYFAGKRYHGLVCFVDSKPNIYWRNQSENLLKLMKSVLSQSRYQIFLEHFVESKTSLINKSRLERLAKPLDIDQNIFRELDTPAFIIQCPGKYSNVHKVIINPHLGDWNVNSLFDPVTCYQEIDMYLGNNLATQFDPSSTKDDILARDMAGFDEQSFKNQAPNQRKTRRKLNKLRKRGINL